jgi:hypothetical protein
MSKPEPVNLSLPSHIREVCRILAIGVMRLRDRNAEDRWRNVTSDGETSLHFLPDQSGHAHPATRRAA